MADAEQLLFEILEQSKKLYELARKGEWDEVTKLESDRRELIEVCFAPNAGFTDPQMASQKIQEIMNLDAKVMNLGAKARNEASQAIAEIQRGRQAIKAYGKTGS